MNLHCWCATDGPRCIDIQEVIKNPGAIATGTVYSYRGLDGEQDVEARSSVGYTGRLVQTNAQTNTASQGASGNQGREGSSAIPAQRSLALALKGRR